MANKEKLHLDILHKIHGRAADRDLSSSSSESEEETESGLSAGTPRSVTSEDSSVLTSPRAHLLWDHAFDVSEGRHGCKSPEERDTEWRRFNKTDDDKLIADESNRQKIKDIAQKLNELNKCSGPANKTTTQMLHQKLPDLIASTSSKQSSPGSSQDPMHAVEELTTMHESEQSPTTEPGSAEDVPPPLPCSSPPMLYHSSMKPGDDGNKATPEIENNVKTDNDFVSTGDEIDLEHVPGNNDEHTVEMLSQNYMSDEDDDSSAGGDDDNDDECDDDDDDDDDAEGEYDGVYSISAHSILDMHKDKVANPEIETNTQPYSVTAQAEQPDIAAEFELLLQSLNLSPESEDTYEQRFANRRDRYGFILSPVMETSSPTPSSMSGYSGISCASPDPFGIFRMSPAPGKGKPEIDLSSLRVKSPEWGIDNEQTVPIYQMVQAKRCVIIPEGYGWDSSDDLLSPTGSCEWEAEANGLSTPPVSANYVNLTQFGTHIGTSWREPDAVIFEERESSDSDSTISGNDKDDSDSTIEDDSHRTGPTNGRSMPYFDPGSSDDNTINDVLNDDAQDEPAESDQTLELSLLEDEIKIIDDAIRDLKINNEGNEEAITANNDDLSELRLPINQMDEVELDLNHTSDTNVNVVSLESSLSDSYRGFSEELSAINKCHNESNEDRDEKKDNEATPVIRLESKQTFTTSDDESDSTEDSDDDAEDEYSGSDNEKETDSDCGLFKTNSKLQMINHQASVTPSSRDTDNVHVGEMLSPRSAILMSGGMFPQVTDSSSSCSSDEDNTAHLPRGSMSTHHDTDISIRQYTSGDSDDNAREKTLARNCESMSNNEQKTQNIVSFRKTYGTSKSTTADRTNTDTDRSTPKAIISPLDFSILDSNIEPAKKSEQRQSPRIFGRYYAEMDKDLIDKVRAQRERKEEKCDEESEQFKNESHTETFLKRLESDREIDELESSFKNIVFANKRSAIQPQRRGEDVKSIPQERVTSLTQQGSVCTEGTTIEKETTVKEASLGIGGLTEKVQSDRQNKFHNKLETPPKPKKTQPVKIKMGPLVRRGSARSKVKQGFVHELTGMFDHKNDNPKEIIVKKKQSAMAGKETVNQDMKQVILTPNENMFIATNDDTDIDNMESLGFEVTPFEKVDSFEPTISMSPCHNGDKANVGLLDYGEDFDTSSSESESDDNSDNIQLKLYESRLRDLDTTGEISHELYVENSNTMTDDLEVTTEFIPQVQNNHYEPSDTKPIHALTQIHQVEQIDNMMSEDQMEFTREEEIEESIDGDSSDLSEDEELHERYHLTGDFYHSDNFKEEFNLYGQEQEAENGNTQMNNRKGYVNNNRETEPDKMNNTIPVTSTSKEAIHPSWNDNGTIAGVQPHIVTNIGDNTGHVNIYKGEVGENDKDTDDTRGVPSGHRSRSISSRNDRRDATPVEKESGVLYDIIARIDARSRGECIPPKCNCNDVSDYHEMDRTSPIVVDENNDTNATNTGVTENDDHFSHRHRTELPDYLKEFEIRYPASLSRRLYGPYCRIRGINMKTRNSPEITNDENEPRETTTPGLNNDDSMQSYLSNGKLNPLRGNYDNLHVHTVENTESMFQTSSEDSDSELFNNSHRSLSSGNVLTGDNSLTNISPRQPKHLNDNLNEVSFTCYDVKTPFAQVARRERIKNRREPITDSGSNQAQRENHFVNANRCSVVERTRLCTDAQSDKQEFDLTGPTCSNEITACKILNSEHEINENLNNSDRTRSISDCDSECSENNNVDLSCSQEGKKWPVNMKNDIYHKTLGVHDPMKIASHKVTHQSGTMTNGMLSSERKISEAKIHLHGINDSPELRRTENINSSRPSSGDAFTNEDSQIRQRDKKLPAAGGNTRTRTSVVIQTPGYQHVLEDEKGKLRIWPYSDFDNIDKLPVTLHRAKKRINLPVGKGMSDSKMTVIQSAQHSSQVAEDKMVNRYQSSSVVPGDQTSDQIMKVHGDSVQSVLLQDSNGNALSEEELQSVLPKIADTISKLDSTEAQDILPGISQSITKLKSGGNLVITTMTRRLDEEESVSSGRGSPVPEPEHPVMSIDDLENSKLYLVRDSQGELFYVEDVTSESQESAYFSSKNSEGENSPIFDRVSNLQTVGNSGIQGSTANEILSAMYGANDIQEINENEEEWSERTYEFDRSVPSKNAFKSQYMVEEPDTLPRTNATREMAAGQMSLTPWVYDGGLAQSYSQNLMAQNSYCADDSLSLISAQNAGVAAEKTIERYTIEGEITDYPIVPPPPPEMMLIPPPMVVPAPPTFVKVTPAVKDEGTMVKYEPPKEDDERLIYKTVAHVHQKEKEYMAPKKEVKEKKKYKILSSKSTETEEQESHMRFEDVDYKYTSENIEYKSSPAVAQTQYYVRNSTNIESPQSFRSEKKIELAKSSDQKYKSEIQVKDTRQESMEQSSYSYDEMKSHMEQSGSDMRVVRGSYLIKNTLDGVDGFLDDNINMFDGKFELCKDNPLYKSDEELYHRMDKERTENARKQERFQRNLNQDVTFETVDKFSKTKNVKREAERPRQSLTEILLSRLSTVDSKHISQKIDVKHNSEDIYGDPRLLHADGQTSYGTSGTNNFDTVGEKVDLLIKEGKAFIVVTVTAERITPIDLDFNVWRKNQAIVTRTIQVDLLATEHRRRLYYKVMDTPSNWSRGSYTAGSNETVLDSQETLELFTKILDASEGEGDREDIEMRTSSGRTKLPFATGMDLLY